MKHFIFGLLLGAGVGSGVTYFLCKSHFKKTLEEERAKIRAEYKEYYERKQEEEDEAKAKHKPAVPDKPVETTEEYLDKKEYKEIVRSYRKTEDELVEETENIEKMHDALEKTHDRVKILQPESFGEITSYECESLTYYVYDRTLCHENGDIVDDSAFLIGDALERYGWDNNDENEDPLYVRNYKLAKDFEVVKVLDEYPEK